MHKPLINSDWSIEFHNYFTTKGHEDKRFRVIGTATSKSNNKAKFAYDLIKNIDSLNTKSIQRKKLAELNPYVLD